MDLRSLLTALLKHFRWNSNRQTMAGDIPTLVKLWSTSTRAEAKARKAQEAYEALPPHMKTPVFLCRGSRSADSALIDVPAFLRQSVQLGSDATHAP